MVRVKAKVWVCVRINPGPRAIARQSREKEGVHIAVNLIFRVEPGYV